MSGAVRKFMNEYKALAIAVFIASVVIGIVSASVRFGLDRLWGHCGG